MSRLNVGSFRHPDGTADNISLTSTGRVGIGIASPSQLLEINGASTPGVQIKDTTNNVIARIGANDNTGLIGTRSNHPTVFQINDAEVARLDTSGNLQFNSGYGSVATAYGVRAWASWRGDITSGGNSQLDGSGNVSSVTDNGTGDYTINFTNAMPDTNYVVAGHCIEDNNQTKGDTHFIIHRTVRATGSFRVNTLNFSGATIDADYIFAAVMR